eukprot:scaffold76561_cov62-Phaeocystis_antarctica.AAC.5
MRVAESCAAARRATRIAGSGSSTAPCWLAAPPPWLAALPPWLASSGERGSRGASSSHAKTEPSEASAAEWLLPHTTCTACGLARGAWECSGGGRATILTLLGTGRSSPHDQRRPSAQTAAQCAGPAAALATRTAPLAWAWWSDSTARGVTEAWHAAGGRPSCPRALLPQAKRRPSCATARQCSLAAATATVTTTASLLWPKCTRRGVHCAAPTSYPSGACMAPQLITTPPSSTSRLTSRAAATLTTRRAPRLPTRFGSSTWRSSPWPSRPPTPRPQLCSPPASSTTSMWCLAVATEAASSVAAGSSTRPTATA